MVEDSRPDMRPVEYSEPSSPRADSPDQEKCLSLSDDGFPHQQDVQTKVEWADDTENPQNWPFAKRCFHTMIPTLIAFVTTLASSIYTPGRDEVQAEFGVSSTVAILPFSFYTLGLAFGPLIASPCSENFGRRAVYFVCTPIFGLFTLGSGFSQSIASLTVCRFFAGCFGSPALSVGNATLSDVWAPHERAIPMAIIVCAPFLGPTLGPLIGGFVAEGKGWRWTQWVILFFTVAFLSPAFFMSETYRKQILQRRAKRQQRLESNGPELHRTETAASRASRAAQGMQALLMNTIGRPVHMLVTEPIIGLFSLYVAFIFAMQYAFFAAFPWVFSNTYGFSIGAQGLTFLGLGVGCLLGFTIICISNIWFDKPRAQRWRERQQQELEAAAGTQSSSGVLGASGPTPARRTSPPPEFVLSIAFPGSVVLPAALFMFAWTAHPSVHWIVPIVAETLFGTSNLLIFMACTLYLMNTYGPMYGASAMAACSLLRYVLGAVFPLFILQMYEALGTGWATSLLGFVSMVLGFVPWGFVRWGERLRGMSKYPCEG
ncbi:benomyl methotrexate resistance protein [Diplodia corticola]|uniref:Benomyl methotrexate resistance protein n=1 Tax=Diplodia corticola TaxID=236234 RepID=A0A1J9S7C3_9PEZI|nr:benomyl methotrexate resistance protein [Diplodia corticola]OJD35820.1 benomyl methotrexate resistance protein [Diplodia corticola]